MLTKCPLYHFYADAILQYVKMQMSNTNIDIAVKLTTVVSRLMCGGGNIMMIQI